MKKRRLHLDVADAELAKRRQASKPPPNWHDRGYAERYIDHVVLAHRGADLAFLVGKSGGKLARGSHYAEPRPAPAALSLRCGGRNLPTVPCR